VPSGQTLSATEARWLAIAAQGLAAPRGHDAARRPGRARLTGLLDTLGTLQLDAVNVLERTQFVVPFSRLGAYDREVLADLSGPGRPWFEYWGHAASLLPVAMYPLFRPRMAAFSRDEVDSAAPQRRRHAWRLAHADYLAAVLAEVADRGPVAASQLSDPRRRAGEWWDRRSLGRRALELLFGDGVLAGWRSRSFERVYDLAERVLPPAVLEAPAPSLEEANRELLTVAARCLGVGTAADLADYFWLRVPAARPRIAELVEEGRLTAVRVEGWREPAYVAGVPGPRPPRREGATLLSPFDSLIWYRARTERLFGFHYRIGIYLPEPQRPHGYYVLPLLVADRLVGRLDLKADRASSTLRVVAAYHEPGEPPPETAAAAAPELRAMAAWLGLGGVEVRARGDLAPSLRTAVRASV